MSKRQFSFPFFGILIIVGIIFGYKQYQKSQKQPVEEAPKQTVVKIKVALPEVVDELIPLKYTCEGEGISPAITISNLPKETKSLAVIVDDKDASFGVFTHWLMWNIEGDVKKINEGETPVEATVGKNSDDKPEWSAICPPAGPMHHYRFKVYALSDYLDLPVEETKPVDLVKATKKLLVGYGETIAVFGK